jgi:hypothetical protein
VSDKAAGAVATKLAPERNKPPAPTDACSLHGLRHQFQDLHDAIMSVLTEGDTAWPGAIQLAKSLKDQGVVK